VTTRGDVDALRLRIEEAEARRDALRADGPEEKFLEAYVIVKALQLELEERLVQKPR
jgi:hypothetical protein